MKIVTLARLKQRIALPKSKALTCSLLGVTIVAGALTGLATKPVDAAKPFDETNTTIMLSHLNALQAQLASLQDTVNKPWPSLDLSAIAEKINQVSARLETLQSVDADELKQRLGETLTHTESALGDKLNAIQATVTHLETRQTPFTYLKPEVLPFKVVSIDSIQQVPVASIAYDYKTVPLEKGDALAGWKVVKVDYGKQRMELENARAERVLVTHEHVG